MLIFSLLVYALALSVQAGIISSRDEKPTCRSYHTDFTKSIDGWTEVRGATRTWEVTPEGLKLKLLRPERFNRLIDTSSPNRLAYNDAEGEGATFNASTYMLYGRFSVTLKSAKVGGAVTAMILIADDKDEIDYELLGKGNGLNEQVQTNYFWGKNIVYGKNGGEHEVDGSISSQFHTYEIDWSPEHIKWSVNGNVIRIKSRQEANGEYPTSPARVQIGLWDGSRQSGTADWAHGPIEWNGLGNEITATIKSVEIECNPEYNIIIH
ncbi:concanavalin A-like lectin/glucanase [Rhizopus microsporus var. microsporus]|uniref:Concanavalin A-like lectin/glucanase n=2 Tax=Rhizopus microsporus TaxID=58291 RepID=A0A2G4SLG4_RHIZD|nr:concanavalin A-like lectin/glucanase [Rhizopus microsporus ATCC 52813]ORE01717.1 concanavalin A-like lectin/glucanase [Rhizopus microsporus var. microsporus]PHZ09618.1 concanavalin A-like lectin/glucanase [Rhizopus microsporus ATCC 52813]